MSKITYETLTDINGGAGAILAKLETGRTYVYAVPSRTFAEAIALASEFFPEAEPDFRTKALAKVEEGAALPVSGPEVLGRRLSVLSAFRKDYYAALPVADVARLALLSEESTKATLTRLVRAGVLRGRNTTIARYGAPSYAARVYELNV